MTGVLKHEDGGRGEALLELCERLVCLERPLELGMRRGQCMQRDGNCSEVADKASVKVGKPQKLLHQRMAGGHVPIRNSSSGEKMRLSPR